MTLGPRFATRVGAPRAALTWSVVWPNSTDAGGTAGAGEVSPTEFHPRVRHYSGPPRQTHLSGPGRPVVPPAQFQSRRSGQAEAQPRHTAREPARPGLKAEPQANHPCPVWIAQPGMDTTGPVPVHPPSQTVPIEQLIQQQKLGQPSPAPAVPAEAPVAAPQVPAPGGGNGAGNGSAGSNRG